MTGAVKIVEQILLQRIGERSFQVKRELVIVLDFGGQYNQLVVGVSANVMYIVRSIPIRPILKRSRR